MLHRHTVAVFYLQVLECVMLSIEQYSDKYQPEVKSLVIAVHEEFGFPYDHTLDFDLDDLSGVYIKQGGALYVLLEGERVVGTAAVKRIDDETAEIKRMYVLREYRGQGWGSKLLDTALAFCKEEGFKRAVLDTNEKQTDALRLYERRGFKVYKREEHTIFMS